MSQERLLNPQQEYQNKRFENALKRASLFKKETEKGLYLYLLRCNEFYKIGIASNMNSRLNSLQCGNPYNIEIITAKRIKDAREIEQALHEKLFEFKHKREWFLLDDIDGEFVVDLKEFIENYE